MHVLAIGAHPNDIELGCRGALTAHREAGDRVHLLVMTGGGRESRDQAALTAEEASAARLGADLVWAGLDDGAVPEDGVSVVAIQAAVARFGVSVVYTPTPRDTDPDHRATAAATVAACRLVCRVRHYETATTLAFQHRLCRQRPPARFRTSLDGAMGLSGR